MSLSRQRRGGWIWGLAVAFAAMAGGSGAMAQGNQEPSLTGRVIVVSIPDRKLVLLEGGAVKRVYPVAVGKASTPSPAGEFRIVRRVSEPTYSHNGRVVAPGPKNPVGSRWMGLSAHGYGIHGTNEPGSIGKAASHGCIRMGKADIEVLYAQVEVGDAVEIHAQRDATVTMALGVAMPVLLAVAPVTVVRARPVLLAENATGNAAGARGQAQ